MPTPKIPFPVDQIAAFCQKWKITELAVFGSVLLGLAALVGLAGHFATARQDDDE